MKMTKVQNPYNVKAGQKWYARDVNRPNEFEVKKLVMIDNEPYAEVYREATDKKSKIRLDRFNKYVQTA